jgi:CheY-like chemotaxis protein
METPKRILVADDEEWICNHFQSKLEKAGYEVVTVDDGDKVMPELLQSRFDLLISDVVMYEKDVFTVLKELNQHPIFRFLPVIIMGAPPNDRVLNWQGELRDSLGRKTWMTDDTVPPDCFAQEITCIWMIKTFDPKQILAAVRSLLPS